jgi:6-phosphofructo-2-kinase/fructose-2,6-biphosphatase 2
VFLKSHLAFNRSGVHEDHTASYFSHNNTEATRLRDQLASDSLEMLIKWLRDGGNVGIHGGDHIVYPYPHDLTLPVRRN